MLAAFGARLVWSSTFLAAFFADGGGKLMTNQDDLRALLPAAWIKLQQQRRRDSTA